MKKPRPNRHLLTAALACAAASLFARPADARPNLDPFAKRAGSPSPFRVAQAEEEPTTTTTATTTATATTARATTGGNASGQQCSRDDQCPADTICEDGVCQAFERSIDVLLYRKAGRNTQFLPFYFSDRGNPGHRVVAPLYFHFWSPESRTRIVAPFYWRVEDHLKQRVVLVIGLYSQTTQPDARSWAVWPFFYLSTKFGWASAYPVALVPRSAIRITASSSACGSCSTGGRGPPTRSSISSSRSRFPRALRNRPFTWMRPRSTSTGGTATVQPALGSPLLSAQNPTGGRHAALVAGLPSVEGTGHQGLVPVALLVRPLQGVELRRALSALVELPLPRRQHHHPAAALPLPQRRYDPRHLRFLGWWASNTESRLELATRLALLLPTARARTAPRPSTCGRSAPTGATTRPARAT